MPAGVEAVRTAIPGNLPHGQEYEAIFGGLPQTATPGTQHLAIAIAALVAAMLLLGWGRFARVRLG